MSWGPVSFGLGYGWLGWLYFGSVVGVAIGILRLRVYLVKWLLHVDLLAPLGDWLVWGW